jgi:hypothetical protein
MSKKRHVMGEAECPQCERTVRLISDELPSDLGSGECCGLLFILQPDGRCDVYKKGQHGEATRRDSELLD